MSELTTTKPETAVETALGPLRHQVGIVRALAGQVLQRYTVSLQGKQYVTVAGATLVANGMGYTVREVSCTRVEVAGVGAFEAVCEVVDIATGAVIGRGSAICADDERMWAKRDLFARRAMAVTRASGRALRLCLGHLFCYLGDRVQATTAEEMPADAD